VDHEGRIALPEIGPMLVNGQTLGDVQQSVQRLLRTQFRDVSADVSLSRLRTVRVYVVGDVNHPGPYDVSSLSTPLNALLAAGGPTLGGSMRIVQHFRGNTLVQQVDLYDLLLRGVRTDIKRLEPGDTLLVPAVGALVQMDGMVRRPAIYELRGETTLAQAIDMAGGILPTAALSHIEVQRLEAHEKRTMLSLDISGTTDASDIEAKLAAFQVRDRDEIHIFPIATFNQDAVYLEGHALRAGRYAYKPGMKLRDLISSYSDLLPEPSTKYAEIIHLNPPDYHPTVESFDLAAALSNPAAAPELKPLDTVRIFSRFDFEDAPSVSVSGAVRNPGTFETSGQIHLLKDGERPAWRGPRRRPQQQHPARASRPHSNSAERLSCGYPDGLYCRRSGESRAISADGKPACIGSDSPRGRIQAQCLHRNRRSHALRSQSGRKQVRRTYGSRYPGCTIERCQ
jgi:protein involved in polysaccharide export with SLBB domain